MEKRISKGFVGLCLGFLLLGLNHAQCEEPPLSSSYGHGAVQQLLEKKKWPEAIVLLRAMLKNEHYSAQTVTDLSIALTYVGNRGEALEVLQQAIQKANGIEKTYLIRRMKVLSRLFLTHRTFQVYQEGLNSLVEKKYRVANERFQKALVDEPENIEILIRMGQSSFLDGDYEKAVLSLKKAIQWNAYQPEARLWLGKSLFQMSQFSESISELNRSLNEMKNFELASLWLSEALFSAGQVNSAIRLLETDVKQQPLHVLNLMNLAKYRTQLLQNDSRTLWAARKDLQLAMSRLDDYSRFRSKEIEFFEESNHLEADFGKSSEVIKNEILRLQQQVETRLKQISDHR